jgi:phosphoserine phosphatase
MSDIKLCIFDLEGTLFKKSYRFHSGREFQSAWGALCSILGPEAEKEDDANRQRFYQGSYAAYSHWVSDTILIHQKYRLSRTLFDEVITSVEYHHGVSETLSSLINAGIITAVISGGLKALADRVAIEHKVPHCYASAEYFWDDDGALDHWNITPSDFSHKATIAKLLCNEHGIEPEQCAFVGDGLNDCDIAKYAGISIAFNPHNALKEVATYVIEQGKGYENMTAVLDYLV